MAKGTKAGGSKTKDTEVAILIQEHDAAIQSLDDFRALVKKMTPEFLAKIGIPGKQFEVTVTNKGTHPHRRK